ncbi:restriction endonuclease [Halogeometricum sp. CBA1124]|uniref:restriction endonuclease n=1 Tax=Halogeometricum sp. CBA1124 TaxID=2668071 RepID=UPI00142B65D0|nr:hypothetical protein [Halogeometricum sp. CBA1124]
MGITDLTNRSTNKRKAARKKEHEVSKFYESNFGYDRCDVTPATRDGGKDFVCRGKGRDLHAEVKHWKRPVSSHEVKRMVDHGLQNDVDVAVHSTNGFTAGAEKLAGDYGVKITDKRTLRALDRTRQYIAKHGRYVLRHIGSGIKSLSRRLARTTASVAKKDRKESRVKGYSQAHRYNRSNSCDRNHRILSPQTVQEQK